MLRLDGARSKPIVVGAVVGTQARASDQEEVVQSQQRNPQMCPTKLTDWLGDVEASHIVSFKTNNWSQDPRTL